MTTAAHAMVLASLVGDSLALGLHWIYDTTVIAGRVDRLDDLLEPAADGYHPGKKRGDLTHYGDQALHLLDHLAANQGRFALAEYGREWRKFITSYGGYMDRASKASLQNLEAGHPPESCGSPSTDLGGATRIAPLIFALRHHPSDLEQAVAAQTALTHQDPGAVAAAVFLANACCRVLEGASLRQALAAALTKLAESPELALRVRDAIDRKGGEITATVKNYGQACAVNGALPAAIFTALQLEDNLKQALAATVMAGGDSAARAMVVGMLLGARHGLAAIPANWLEGLRCRTKVEEDLLHLGKAENG